MTGDKVEEWQGDKRNAQPVAQIGFSKLDVAALQANEMGHILGLPDLDPSLYPDQLMTTTIGVGIRRLPPHMNG